MSEMILDSTQIILQHVRNDFGFHLKYFMVNFAKNPNFANFEPILLYAKQFWAIFA